MEFWGVEVKPGNALKVKPEEYYLIHLSQAALGESKKGKASEPVPLFVKVGDQKIVMGTLSHEKFPQLSFDLIFEKEFELSHNWKNGSVYFFGYKTPSPEEEEEDLFADLGDSYTSSDEEELLVSANNGKPLLGVEKENPAKAKTAIPETSDSSSDDSDDDESDEETEKDSMDEDSDSEDEAEETKKKVELGKKRANDSATKTPISSKKAKLATQKTDGKKGGHTATPHPAKQTGRTPASSSQSPKSGGQLSCKSCTKTFSSDVGLQSHTKAKHSGK